MIDDVKVGIADLNVVRAPGKIMTIGLGSCVGIAIYDRRNKIAGLAHIMLADSTQFKKITNTAKYADLAIPELVKKMINTGSLKRDMTAKIAGGASMFNFSDTSMISDIGKRNGEAVKKALEKEGIRLISEDIGGSKGRTMIFDAENGEVTLKIVGQGVKII